MNIYTNFTANKSLEEIQKFTKYYFVKHGYQVMESTIQHQEFVKGSKFINYISFNPLRWKNKVKIDYEQCHDLNTKIKYVFEIDTSGQMVTEKEEGTWTKFAENYQLAIKQGKYFNSNDLGKQTKKESLGIIFKALGLALAMALIAAFIMEQGKRYFGYKINLVPLVVGITIVYIFSKFGKIKK